MILKELEHRPDCDKENPGAGIRPGDSSYLETASDGLRLNLGRGGSVDAEERVELLELIADEWPPLMCRRLIQPGRDCRLPAVRLRTHVGLLV